MSYARPLDEVVIFKLSFLMVNYHFDQHLPTLYDPCVRPLMKRARVNNNMSGHQG